MAIASMVIVGVFGLGVILAWLIDKIIEIVDGNPGDHF